MYIDIDMNTGILIAMEHRNGCDGCDHDPMSYPRCWTHEQVTESQQHLADFVRVAHLTEYQRAVDNLQAARDAIELENMRHRNELERLEHAAAQAEAAVAQAAMAENR